MHGLLKYSLACLLACVIWQPACATEPDELGAADALTMELLGSLKSAYAGIASEREGGNALALKIQFDLAIQCLTDLQQLFGFDWAAVRLKQIYLDEDCPDLHMGYSADRRVLLRIEPMELKNPAFSEHSFFLCTLESQHEANIESAGHGQLLLELRNGDSMHADVLTDQHELWEFLNGQADGFAAPARLDSGRNVVFKQIYKIPQLSRDSISAVSLDWDEHHFRLEWFENEVAID